MDTHKHATPDSEGLQIVERQDLPEVVPNQPPPNLVHRSSFDSPEPFHNPVDESQNQKQPLFYGDAGAVPGTSHSEPPPQYANEKQGLAGVEAGGDKAERRMCGMKRRVAIIVFAIVAFVIIIAVVLGAVLGTVLDNNNNKSNNSSKQNSTSSVPLPSPLTNAGVSILQPENDSHVYSYYQASNGSIFEAQYSGDPWSNSSSVSQVVMIAENDILDNSPIASISYTRQGSVCRQIFFFDSNGLLSSANVTGNNTWMTPYNLVAGAAAFPKTPTLAACADTNSNALNGIRVYYGGAQSNGNFIQEVGLDFDENVEFLTWHIWFPFTGSDPSSGAACALQGTESHVYLYNTTANNMVRLTYDYANVTTWQQDTTSPSSGNVMAKGSIVAAASDNVGTDYIFYQTTQNQTIRAQWTGSGFSNYQSGISSLNGIGIGDNIAAAYIGGNSVVLNQNGSASNQFVYTSDNRVGSLSVGSTTTT